MWETVRASYLISYPLVKNIILDAQKEPRIQNITKPNKNINTLKANDKHYENTPIQICRKFHLKKTEKISDKNLWYYENTPIQIYRKFHLQKLKFTNTKIPIFCIFLLVEAVLTKYEKQCISL